MDETSLIDRTEQEHTRLVLGKIAPDEDLSSVEYETPFFKPSFETPKDGVHVQYPYVSPDTHRLVFAYTTPIVLSDGTTPAFYHFEMPLALLQNMITKSAPQGVRLFISDPRGFLIANSQTDFLKRNQTSSSFAHVNSARECMISIHLNTIL